jgi:hypothetical protein
MQKRLNSYGVWWGNLKKRDYLESSDINEDNIKIDLKRNEMAWTGFIWLTIGTVVNYKPNDTA